MKRKPTRFQDVRRRKFIQEMITVEDVLGTIRAYKKAYPQCKKDTSARVNAYKLLAKPDIVAEIDRLKQEREEKIKQAEYEFIQKLARDRVISQIQIEAVLSDIVLGKFKRKRVIAAIDSKSGKLVKAEVEDSLPGSDMIAAADKLLRVKGAYAPEKVQHEAGDSWIEAMKELSKSKEQ